jgi:hypothetical protein
VAHSPDSTSQKNLLLRFGRAVSPLGITLTQRATHPMSPYFHGPQPRSGHCRRIKAQPFQPESREYEGRLLDQSHPRMSLHVHPSLASPLLNAASSLSSTMSILRLLPREPTCNSLVFIWHREIMRPFLCCHSLPVLGVDQHKGLEIPPDGARTWGCWEPGAKWPTRIWRTQRNVYSYPPKRASVSCNLQACGFNVCVFTIKSLSFGSRLYLRTSLALLCLIHCWPHVAI